MKKYFLPLIFIAALTTKLTAQKQGNIWYFGSHAGVDFNSGSPVFISGGQTHYVGCPGCHAEGTSSICDSSGSLLFYCDGQTIWNKNHQVMMNGDSLYSNASSTQSSLIVPFPGSNQYFYVFTTDDFYFDNLAFGFRYSIIDICLDYGLGGVIPFQKNILLLNYVSEKLTAVRDNNGKDYWIIIHKYFSDEFYSYKLSSSGISNPVVSHAGSVNPSGTNTTDGAIGQMKASPNGQKLVVVNGNSGINIAEYFDFNNITGNVSNCVNLVWNSVINFYGASFSPDNSKLYISSILNGNGVYQFDLNAGGGNPDSVRASRVNVTSVYGYGFMALQLAVDGKIYVTHTPFYYNPFLSVINSPNSKGLSCNYIDNSLSLNGNSASYGLPTFIDSYDYSNSIHYCSLIIADFFSSDTSFCEKNCINFFDLSTNNPTSWQWFFPGADTATSSLQNPTNICYSTYGSFDVTLIACNAAGCDTLHLTNFITCFQNPVDSIYQSNDTLYSLPAFSYQWYETASGLIAGATNQYYVSTQPGSYFCLVTDSVGCEASSNVVTITGYSESLIFNSSFLISPNPNDGSFEIAFVTPFGGNGALRILNTMGQTVFTQPLTPNSQPLKLDLSFLENGIYFLEITINNERRITKFIKD